MEFSNQFNDSFRQGLIAGYFFTVTFVIVFYMSYCLPTKIMKKRKKKNLRHKKIGGSCNHNSNQEKIKEKLKKVKRKDKMLPIEFLDKRIQINKVGRLTNKMNFTEFYHATQYFSKDNVIGVGVTGIMYKATLSNGCIFAAKRLHDSQLCIKRFKSEIKILGQYSHRNILPLIGFCIEEEKNERVLVYQYMSNGRLSDWLNDDTTTLGWSRVIQIALGIARGLCCLHHSLHMVHLNISSKCILLGNNFEPKISNFGGAMFMNNDVNKNIGFGKKDVYDFGCLLFELIKGKEIGQISDCSSNTNVPFATYTYPNPMNLLEDHFGFYDAVNESLNKIEFEDEVSALLRVACDCVHPFLEQRPTMHEVYSYMGNIWERDDICDDPDLLSIDFEAYRNMGNLWKRDDICEDPDLLSIDFEAYSVAPHKQLEKKKNRNSRQNKDKELGKYIYSITSKTTQRIANYMHELLHPQLVEKGSKEHPQISILMKGLTSTIWLDELRDATDCFAVDNAIGVGKMGLMYQGFLPNGQLVAVKRLFDTLLFKRQFLLETTILCKYRHKNIVPLIGFCIEGKERLLAYAYMSNGRLSKWLHPLESEVIRLKWHDRVNIALGIARGLSWLHHTCNLGIVHFNICSECILLDENFEPKISNFGEAKFMNPNIEDHLGTMFKVNDGKKDVYDFGSVLFELMTGKTYNELSHSSDTTNLCGNPLSFYNVIDKSLTEEGLENEVCTLIKIACECVHPFPDQRPTMLDVYNNMSNVRKGQNGLVNDSGTLRGLEYASSITIDEIVEF